MLKKIGIKQVLFKFQWIFTCAFGMIQLAGLASAEDSRYYKAEARRDPFVPLVSGGIRPSGTAMSIEVPEDLILEGIAYDPKGSIVVVNGSMMKQGESLGNTKVVRIEESRAVFEVNGIEVIREVNPNPAGAHQ